MTIKHTKNIKTSQIVNEFQFDLMVAAEDGMGVVKIGEHTCYNLDGKVKMSDWVRGELPKCSKSVCTTDGIKTISKNDKAARGTIAPNSLGYLCFNSNVVEKNAQYVILTSLPISVANGFNLLPENFDRAVSGFAARRLVVDNVWNDKDSYMVPNMEHPMYNVFQQDSFIFALFDHQSYQTSIKGAVDGEDYDFKNNFYPFTKAETYEALGLEKKQNFKDESRFIRESGKLGSLTPEGRAVLDAFKECLRASAKARPDYSKAHPELQVARWDCGWRQLKGLFAEACPEQFADLKAKFNTLKAKMLPLVYELGFLRK